MGRSGRQTGEETTGAADVIGACDKNVNLQKKVLMGWLTHSTTPDYHTLFNNFLLLLNISVLMCWQYTVQDITLTALTMFAVVFHRYLNSVYIIFNLNIHTFFVVQVFS